MKWGKNDPGKISAKSDNWFKSYGQKFEKRHFLGTSYMGQITRFPGTRILPITRFLLPGSWQPYLYTTLQTLTGKYRDLTAILVNRDVFITVFGDWQGLHVAHDRL